MKNKIPPRSSSRNQNLRTLTVSELVLGGDVMVEERLTASSKTTQTHRRQNLKGLTIDELAPKGAATIEKITVRIPNGKRI